MRPDLACVGSGVSSEPFTGVRSRASPSCSSWPSCCPLCSPRRGLPTTPRRKACGCVFGPHGRFQAATRRTFWGTDPLGRDLLSRILHGARVSLGVGIGAVLLQAVIGVTAGLLAGFHRGAVDQLVMRLADVQQSIPFLVLVVAVAAVVGPSLRNTVLVLGVAGWVTYGRVVRAQVLSLMNQEYVTAAQALGVRDGRVMLRHLLPNLVAPISVIGTLTVSTMILVEASLSFLGLGVPPPAPTWGGMVADGRNYIADAWWVSVMPGLAIFATVLAINIVGDALREALDPSLRT